MNKIITISRQYASGGREVGEKLAKAYGIPFYDNDLITRAAKESGFAEEAFRAAETKATNSFLYSIAMGMSSFGGREFGTANLSLDDRIIAVADICDALLATDRPYKKPIPKEKAFDIMRGMAKDGNIDGRLVEYLYECIDD